MAGILKIAWLELENFLGRKILWLLTAAYAAFTFAVCLLPDLRQSYFSGIGSVPVMLLDLIAPVVLAGMIISVLSPVFVGDREKNADQIPAACLAGRTGRSIAKMIAAILFSVLVCLVITVITFIATSICGLFDGALEITYVGAELKLAPIWSTWRHFGFSFVCLTVACMELSLFVMFISCSTGTTIAAVSVSSVFVLFEFLFHRFSFPKMMQEYNVWVFFEPYYFFALEIFNSSPYGNLLLLSAAFLPPDIFAVWQIVKKGT